MGIHEQIKALIDQGETVYSFAAGRVGKIVDVDTNPLFPIVIEHMRGRGRRSATTFRTGDKVKLQERQDYKGEHCWAVVNALEDYHE